MKKRKQNIIPLSNTTLKKIVTRVLEEKSKEPKTLHERIDRQFAEASKVLNEQRPEDYGRKTGEGARQTLSKTKSPEFKDPVSIFLSNVMLLAKELQKWEKANPNAIRTEFGKTPEYKNSLKVLKRTFPKG